MFAIEMKTSVTVSCVIGRVCFIVL